MDDQNNGMNNPIRLDVESLQARLKGKRGKEYWKSFEELADTPEFHTWVDDEFPHRKTFLEMDRRDFVKLMGASMMLAGLSGCRSYFLPQQKIVPFVKPPVEMTPGVPLHFATTMTLSGYGLGVVVKSNMGRPTKIEGNPKHPASLGSTDVYAQAAILDFYDPGRSQSVENNGYPSTWDAFFKAAGENFAGHKADGGAGMRILTESISSPTLESQLNAILKEFPNAKWLQWEPVNRDSAYLGAKSAFGTILETTYKFQEADVVVSLDADFFQNMPGSVRYARDFMDRRRITTDKADPNRLYVFESTPTLAGVVADHRVPVKPSQVELVARALAAAVGVPGVSAPAPLKGVNAKLLDGLVTDLKAKQGKSIVIAGEQASPAVHALVNAINAKLGNVTYTVFHVQPALANPTIQGESIAELAKDMNEGRVSTLLILGGNPAYNAPSDTQFADGMKKVALSAHLTTQPNETTDLCAWHLPESHFLESWGDARAFDGTTSIVQPLIAPLFDTRSQIELLSSLRRQPKPGYDLVREYWKGRFGGGVSFEKSWNQYLLDGFIPGTESKEASPTLLPITDLGPEPKSSGTEIALRPDPSIYDGRFANNGWLQELPKPMSTMTWDNTAQMSPAMAKSLGVANEEVVKVTVGKAEMLCPVWIMPGHPDESITIHLGFGRTKGGVIAEGTGFNAYPAKTTTNPWTIPSATVERAPGLHELSFTQHHWSMEGRDIIRQGTIAEYTKNPKLIEEKVEHGEEGDGKLPSMYPDEISPWDGNKWGLSIDLGVCTGCNACVIACQAENNIPIVGKNYVKRHREMHWLRIDRYYRVKTGGATVDANDNVDITNSSAIETVVQPLTCMHCELAPCEPVCPVAATVHSHEGINQMVYNRCVGTRYCSNNCPYKVRRFNYHNYTDNMPMYKGDDPEATNTKRMLLKMLNNPDVTVRGRGVMEKCTYCVQRINAARIIAKRENRAINDGEVVTACQQACPTKAITFGDIANPTSAVSKLKAQPRSYSLLEDLNTRPRTTYLAKVTNPNTEIENA